MALMTQRGFWLVIAGGSTTLALANCHLCIFQRLLSMLIAPLALIAALTFLVTWAFLLLIVTGILLAPAYRLPEPP